MEFWNTAIFVGALLLVISIMASDISSRLGTPLLLDYELSYVIGTLALAVIIFDGGLRTRRETFRIALWPAVGLATVGVVVTAVLVGFFAAWALGVHWLHGMLLGAIVASTDAAALASVSRPFSRQGWISERKYDGFRARLLTTRAVRFG